MVAPVGTDEVVKLLGPWMPQRRPGTIDGEGRRQRLDDRSSPRARAAYAACRDAPGVYLLAEERHDSAVVEVEKAKAVCRGYPVRQVCLEARPEGWFGGLGALLGQSDGSYARGVGARPSPRSVQPSQG